MKRFGLLVLLLLIMLSGCGGGGGSKSTPVQADSETGTPAPPDPETATEPDLQTIEISSQESEIPVGSELTLSATGHYSDESKQDISGKVAWVSSPEGIVIISPNGRLRGLKPGNVVISATFGDFAATRTLAISQARLGSLQISPADPLPAGESAQLTLIGKYSDETERRDLADQALWEVSEPTVASVTQGSVTGLKPGTVTITASIGETVSEPVELQVTDAVLRSLSITSVEPELPPGEEQIPSSIELPRSVSGTLTVTAHYSDGRTKDVTKGVTWRSNDTSIAQFDVTHPARLAGMRAGRTEIVASYHEMDAHAPVTVFNDIEAARRLLVFPASVTLSLEEKIQLKATGIYVYQTPEGQKTVYWDVTPVARWTSLQPVFAIVSNDERTSGLVTATAYGDAQVSVKYRDAIGNASVVVNGATLERIEVSYPESLTHPHLVIPFKAEGVWSDGHRRDITEEVSWSSSNQAVATVDERGQVKLLPPGGQPVSISASYPGVGVNPGSASIVSTTATPQELWAQPENAIHPLNFDFPYTVKCLFSDGSTADVTKLATWTSSNPAVALINAGGVPGVTRTLDRGTTVIKASWQGLTDYPGGSEEQPNLTVADPLPLELYWIRMTGNERQYPLPEICDGDWCKEFTSAPAQQSFVYRRYRLKAGPAPVTITGLRATSDKTSAAIVGLQNQVLSPYQEIVFDLEAVAPPRDQGRARVQWSFNVEGMGEQFSLTAYVGGE